MPQFNQLLYHVVRFDWQSVELRMQNLTSPKVIWLKGVLFVVLGILAAGLLLVETPTLRSAGLLAIVVWSFCRAYYFAFYVIQSYVDPQYRFAGLLHFVRYAILGHKPDQADDQPTDTLECPGA